MTTQQALCLAMSRSFLVRISGETAVRWCARWAGPASVFNRRSGIMRRLRGQMKFMNHRARRKTGSPDIPHRLSSTLRVVCTLGLILSAPASSVAQNADLRGLELEDLMRLRVTSVAK